VIQIKIFLYQLTLIPLNDFLIKDKIMKKIQIEVELTDKQIDFLKNLELSSQKEFTYVINDYDMYNDLINKGIVTEFYQFDSNDPTEKYLSEIGYQIKLKL
jgi:hypothetical protein